MSEFRPKVLIFTKYLPYLTCKSGNFSIFNKSHLNEVACNIVN